MKIYVFTNIQDGISTLYAASEGGHADIVDMLLKGGADPNVATKVCRVLRILCKCHNYLYICFPNAIIN